MPEKASAPSLHRAADAATGAVVRDESIDASIGTPDAPAFKPRPILFVASLILFASWMAILIYWALQVPRAVH